MRIQAVHGLNNWYGASQKIGDKIYIAMNSTRSGAIVDIYEQVLRDKGLLLDKIDLK